MGSRRRSLATYENKRSHSRMSLFAMIELTAIDIGKARCLLNLRVVAAAFLALAMSLGLPPGAAAVEWQILVVGNLTIFSCSSEADIGAQTTDCSNTVATWPCTDQVVTVERDGDVCTTREATAAEILALITGQEQMVDVMLAAGPQALYL